MKQSETTQLGTSANQLALSLSGKFLRGRERQCTEVVPAMMFYQVGALLGLCYKIFFFRSDMTPYSYTNLQALLLVANVVHSIDAHRVDGPLENGWRPCSVPPDESAKNEGQG